MVERRAGYYCPVETINLSGLPVHAQWKEPYTWENLKEWVSDPNTAVIIDSVPGHSILAFATGETSAGKYRHVLIGRVSGGQSPCSWVPWSKNDKFDDEDVWSSDCSLDDPKIEPLYIQELSRFGGRELQKAIVVKRIIPSTYQKSMFDNFEVPDWLKSKELICDTCVLHKHQGDIKTKSEELIAWLNSD